MSQHNKRKYQAIETKYQGCAFRSRLEARYAVFFDALGIKWEYEPEGFVLADETWYLPDFWLPKFHNPEGLWVEVKPDDGDFDTAKNFARSTGQSILLANGTPSCKAYWIAVGEPAGTTDAIFMDKYITGVNKNEYRLYTGLSGHEVTDDRLDWFGDGVAYAVDAARSARFEHGQTPRF
jgi:hypothetical protein